MKNMTLNQHAQRLLGRPLTPQDGIDHASIQSHLTFSIPLPKALQEFYSALGSIDLFVDGYQHFLAIDKLFIDDDKLVFLQEHQGGIYWAVALEDEQTVYQAAVIDDHQLGTWYAEDFDLTTFLTMLLYWQCVMADEDYHEAAESGFMYFALLSGDQYANNTVSQQYIDQLADHFITVVNGNGLIVYWQSDTLILCILGDHEQRYDSIFALCKNEEDFDLLIDRYYFSEL